MNLKTSLKDFSFDANLIKDYAVCSVDNARGAVINIAYLQFNGESFDEQWWVGERKFRHTIRDQICQKGFRGGIQNF